jgi:hypothetical protein
MYLTATKPITKGDLVSMCKDLNSKHEATGIKFEPEPITEGGVVYKFPDNSPHGEYKTIRMKFKNPSFKYRKSFIPYDSVMHIVSHNYLKKKDLLNMDGSTKEGGDWPLLPPNVMELWEGNNDIILENGLSIGTYLKAFHGAPVFTESELKIFCECAEKIGLNLDSKIPKDKELISYDGNLGKHHF